MIGEFEENSPKLPQLPSYEAEFEDYFRRVQTQGSPGKTLVNISRYYNELSELPDMFSRTSDTNQQISYAEEAIARWKSLFDAIATKYGEAIVPEGVEYFAWVIDRLERYASSGEIPATYAAMLLKYFEGAQPSQIRRLLSSKLGDNDKEIQTIRRYFINSLGRSDEELGRNNGANDHRLGTAALKSLARPAEETKEAPVYIRPNVTYTVNQLVSNFGGNKGVYQRMFDLVADFRVSDEDTQTVQNTLFKVVSEMVRPSQRARLPESIRIDIESEARWLVILCGRELVKGEDGWKSRPSKRRPSIEGVRNFAILMSKLRQSNTTPDEAEMATMSALAKMIEYQKHYRAT